MKLVSLQCPSCSAILKVNADLEQAVCNYCGHSFILDKEIQYVGINAQDAHAIGYNFEQGRIDYQRAASAKKREEAKELAIKIRALIPHLDKLTKPVLKSRKLSNEIKALEMKREEDRTTHFYIKCIAIPSVILILVLLADRIPALAFFIAFLLPISVFACAILIPFAILRACIRKIKLSYLKKAYQQSSNITDAILSEYGFDIVPKEVLNSEALEYIASMLSSGRADNVKDAQLLYGEYCVQRENARYQREALRLQAQQAEESAENKDGIVKGALAVGGAVLLAGWKIAKAIRKR